MKNMGENLWAYLLLTLMAAAFLMFACSEDNPTKPKESPEIPPLSTFLMDFGDFTTMGEVLVNPEQIVLPIPSDIPSGEDSYRITLSQDNWGWAAFHVGVWNIVITVGLAVPVASFVESFSHEPEQQPNGSWVWSYSFTVMEDEYTAELHGDIDNDGTDWEMYISKAGVYQDFLWYYGDADLFLTEGTWTLNKDPEDPIPFIGIQWHRNVQDSTADIKYSNIVPDGPENGSYIHYGITNEIPYDAFYDIYNKGYENLTNIEWNRTTKDGQVKDAHHFGDEDWHCWDGSHEDIECP